jgi:hypothetical protein
MYRHVLIRRGAVMGRQKPDRTDHTRAHSPPPAAAPSSSSSSSRRLRIRSHPPPRPSCYGNATVRAFDATQKYRMPHLVQQGTGVAHVGAQTIDTPLFVHPFSLFFLSWLYA